VTRPRPPILPPVIGLLLAFIAWWVLCLLVHPLAPGLAQRLAVALAALLPAVALLLAMILAQMARRFLTRTVDPLAGEDDRFLRTNQRVITNTVEQLAVFAPALLALAAGRPGAAMASVVALALVFALARLVFWAGYLLGPPQRAAGMAATMGVTIATVLTAIGTWIR
jgi:uncharacterized membrane protein YecN with MAPEG domain